MEIPPNRRMGRGERRGGDKEEKVRQVHANTRVMVCYPEDIDLKLSGPVGSEVSMQLWRQQYLKREIIKLESHKFVGLFHN